MAADPVIAARRDDASRRGMATAAEQSLVRLLAAEDRGDRDPVNAAGEASPRA